MMKPIEDKISQIDKTKAVIAEYKEQANTLVIDGIEDKEGYKAVYDLRQEVKKKRIATSKEIEQLRKPITEMNKRLATFKGAMEDSAKHVETILQQKQDAIDNEKARIKAEEERKRAEALQARINKLISVGMKFEDGRYVLEDVVVEPQDIEGMSDEDFEATVESMELIAEAKRKEEARIKAEEERIRAEEKAKAAEADALRKKNEELLARLKKYEDKDKEEEAEDFFPFGQPEEFLNDEPAPKMELGGVLTRSVEGENVASFVSVESYTRDDMRQCWIDSRYAMSNDVDEEKAIDDFEEYIKEHANVVEQE